MVFLFLPNYFTGVGLTIIPAQSSRRAILRQFQKSRVTCQLAAFLKYFMFIGYKKLLPYSSFVRKAVPFHVLILTEFHQSFSGFRVNLVTIWCLSWGPFFLMYLKRLLEKKEENYLGGSKGIGQSYKWVEVMPKAWECGLWRHISLGPAPPSFTTII